MKKTLLLSCLFASTTALACSTSLVDSFARNLGKGGPNSVKLMKSAVSGMKNCQNRPEIMSYAAQEYAKGVESLSVYTDEQANELAKLCQQNPACGRSLVAALGGRIKGSTYQSQEIAIAIQEVVRLNPFSSVQAAAMEAIALKNVDGSYSDEISDITIAISEMPVTDDSYVAPAPILVEREVITCNTSHYDGAYQSWRSSTEEQRSRGRTRTVIGVGAIVAGVILRGSNNENTRVVGDIALIGGAVMTTLGLIDLADAKMSMPHERPECANSYVRESRRVEIDRKRCVSTRYTEHGFGSSRSYYEVRCSNRRYVTYNRLEAWETSREVVYHY